MPRLELPENTLDRAAVPVLRPFPLTPPGTPYSERPGGVWRRWYELPKMPLMVSVTVDGTPDPNDLNLDAALSVAATRSADVPWYIADRDAWVVPLPLELLGVVAFERPTHPAPLDRPARPAPLAARLPVWAASTFAQDATAPGRWSALCIGHAATVRELLSYIHEVGKRPAWSWKIEELPDFSTAAAREIIRTQRPMPDTAPRWTPPYHHDWAGEMQKRFDRR